MKRWAQLDQDKNIVSIHVEDESNPAWMVETLPLHGPFLVLLSDDESITVGSKYTPPHYAEEVDAEAFRAWMLENKDK